MLMSRFPANFLKLSPHNTDTSSLCSQTNAIMAAMEGIEALTASTASIDMTAQDTQESTASPLMKLPLELLLIVMKNLHAGRQELIRISKVCRLFHATGSFELYKTINLSGAHRDVALALLLRTILQNPELASYIKTLNLGRINGSRPNTPWYSPVPVSAVNNTLDMTADHSKIQLPRGLPVPVSGLYELVRDCVVTSQILPKDEWMRTVSAGHHGSLLALLLWKLHGITSLKFSTGAIADKAYYHNEKVFVDLAFKHSLQAKASAPITKFSQLQHIYYDHNTRCPFEGMPRTQPVPIKALTPLFLPAIQHITLLAGHSDDFASPLRSSSLTSLALPYTDITEAQLSRILLAAPVLKRLKLDLWCDYASTASGRPSFFDCAAIAFALRNCKALEFLKIEYVFYIHVTVDRRPGGGNGQQVGQQAVQQAPQQVAPAAGPPAGTAATPGNPGFRGCIGSMQSFVDLEELEISIAMLLGWYPAIGSQDLASVLPDQLRRLILNVDLPWDRISGWTPEAVVDLLETLLSKRRQRSLPALEYLKLKHTEMSQYDPTISKQDLWKTQDSVRLRGLMSQYGVQIECWHATFAQAAVPVVRLTFTPSTAPFPCLRCPRGFLHNKTRRRHCRDKHGGQYT